MRVYVSVDIEGISGVVHQDMMMPGAPEYDRGRRLMTREANAAIEGLVEAGATYILINDSHGPMRNILIEELHPAAHLLTGSGEAKAACMVEAANEEPFDAAMLIGYHAMAQTRFAIHSHTISGGSVREVRLNGAPIGEIGLSAAALGALGIPTVLVTGDSAAVSEARSLLGPALETVTVKEARGRNAAICRPPAATGPEIAAAARRALSGRAAIAPYLVPAPGEMEIDFQTLVQCERASRVAGVERLGPMTLRIHSDGIWQQYETLWAAILTAFSEPPI